MASVKKITMREYNGTDYDTLYPKTIANQVDGVYNKTEVDAFLANKLDGVESAEYPGCYYRMNGSVVEWVNPPMFLGVEYRTTERYMGKPVYVKAIDFGTLPNSTSKSIRDTSVGSVKDIISYSAFFNTTQGDSVTIPYGLTSSGHNCDIAEVSGGSTGIYVVILTKIDLSANTATIICKYTKNTD